MKPTYDVALVSAAVTARDSLRALLPVLTAALDQPNESLHALREAQRVVHSTANLLLISVKGRRPKVAPRRQDAAQTPWSVRERPQ